MIVERDSPRNSNSVDCIYYTTSTWPHFMLTRKLFHVNTYTSFEEKKWQALLEDIKEGGLSNKANKAILSYIDNKIVNSKITLMKYLNMFNYDSHLTIKHLQNLISLMKKFDISDLGIINDDKNINLALDTGFLNLCGTDFENRPIIAIDILKYRAFKAKLSSKREFLLAIFTYLNRLIRQELIPGAVEQITIFLNLHKMDQTDLIHGYDDVIKFIQYAFPSLLHKIYIYNSSVSSVTTNLLLIQNFLKHNSSRIVNYDTEHFDDYSKEIHSDILLNYFSRTSNIDKNSNDNFSNNDWESARYNLVNFNQETNNNGDPILCVNNRTQTFDNENLTNNKEHLETSISKTNFLNSLSVEKISSFNIYKENPKYYRLSNIGFTISAKRTHRSSVQNSDKKTPTLLVFEKGNPSANCCNFDTCIIS